MEGISIYLPVIPDVNGIKYPIKRLKTSLPNTHPPNTTQQNDSIAAS